MNIKKLALLFALPTLLLSSLVIASPASADSPSGSLACTISGSKVWNVTGNYTGVVPQSYLYMYRGSTYVARIQTANGSNVPVDVQFSGQSTAQTYYLYDGTSSSDPLIGQATCAAVSTPAPTPAAATPAATTTTPTSTPSSSDTTATPTTTPATTTTPTTVSGSGSSSASSYSFSTTTYSTPKGSLKVLVPLLIIVGIVSAFYIFCVWKVFNKAGKPGWAAIVPFYNGWTVYEIGGKPGWWILVALIPFVGIVAIVISILASIEIAKRFGKSGAFGFFLVFLLGFIGWPILAFGKSQYQLPTAPVQNQ